MDAYQVGEVNAVTGARQQVARAAILITFISLFSKVLGFVREQVVANLFGATGLTDAYFSAWAIPLMLVGLFGGAISTAFLPVFLRLMGQAKKEEAWRLASNVWRFSLLILTGVTALAYLAAPLITRLLVPNFDQATQNLTTAMLRVMLPSVILMGTALLYSAVLNAHKQFAWPAIAPAAMNIVLVGTTVLFTRRYGIMGLASSTLFGVLAQQALLWWQVRRNKMPMFRLSRNLEGVGQVWRLAVPILLGTLFSQVYVFVDKGLASGLDTGSIASLNYASKLVQLPIGIFVAALATAIYPTLAELAGRKDLRGLSRTVSTGIRTLSSLILPAAVGMAVLRIPLVTLAYQRGSFDYAATQKTAFALAFYAIGLFGVANIQVITRAFYALEDSATPVRIGIMTAILNIVFDIILVRFLRQGGLALANSIAVLTQMGCLLYVLRKKLQSPYGLLRPLMQLAIASVAMGALVAMVYPLLRPFGQIVSLALATGVGGVAYLFILWLMGYEDVARVFRMVAKRVNG